MFDDFMHNGFPDLTLNLTHQDTLQYAQNQATEQATWTQQNAAHSLPNSRPQVPEPMSTAGAENAAMNLGLMLQTALLRIFSFLSD